MTRRGESTDGFDRALEACLADGFATVRNSWKAGIGGVGVPISFQGETAALTVPVATGSVSEEQMRGEIAQAMLQEANAF